MTQREIKPDAFFIGWSSPAAPQVVRLFWIVAVMFLLGATGAAALLARSFTDPGQTVFGTNTLPQTPTEVTLTGTVTRRPYPVLWISRSERHPRGEAVLLAAEGKFGLRLDDALEGKSITVSGTRVARGDLDMVILTGNPKPAATTTAPPPVEALGTWRVAGEICDGKCATGVMSPGTGLAHKACANLCILGELPPVLVLPAPTLGSQVVLLAGADGKALGTEIQPFIAVPVVLEGALERRGPLLVLRADLTRARRLR